MSNYQTNSQTQGFSKKESGFTMIELLITMAIVAVLTTISLFALRGARESARDARRKADLETIRSGLEIYKADCNTYPTVSPLPSPLVGSGTPSTCLATNTYVQRIPTDPAGGNYFYLSAGSTYILCSTLEDPPTPSLDTSGCGTCAAGACQYKVINP